MERFLKDKEVKPNELSPLTLAFIGDTVFDLLVREELICDANRPANDLHHLAVERVRATAQAQGVEKSCLFFPRRKPPFLSEEETQNRDISRRMSAVRIIIWQRRWKLFRLPLPYEQDGQDS